MTFFDLESPNSYPMGCIGSFRMCTPQLDLSYEVLNNRNIDSMQKFHPREVDVSTTPIGAQQPFGVSSYGVRVSSFMIYV